MSGIGAQRGFIYQSLIAMIECLESTDWDAIKLEPPTDNDKVDIQLYRDGQVLTAIQVKSTQDKFSRPEVERWLNDLRVDAAHANKIQLCLVCDSYTDKCESVIAENSNSIQRMPFTNLEALCAGKLTKYVENAGLAERVRVSDLDLIDASLFSKIHRNSISTDPLSRAEFEEAFRRALPVMPEYNHIMNLCYHQARKESTVASFYEEAVRIIEERPMDSVFGDISLREGYFTPYINVDGMTTKLSQFLEKWVATDDKMIFIYGEPGHGKTSLGWKAMYDFCKNGWLANMVNNVFMFSLNPVNTKILENNSFSLTALLRWGFEREKEISIDECNKALIILDAYDELKECTTNIDFNSFVKRVLDFCRRTGSHVVVTSRTMAISAHLKENELEYSQGSIRAFELQPLTPGAQTDWLDIYEKHITFSSELETQSWQEYRHALVHNALTPDYRELLGVPIIFRMIVAAQYLPSSNSGITKIYDDLFDITWERHERPIDGIEDSKKAVKTALMHHALTLYDSLEETATPVTDINSTWLFSFYTKVQNNGDGTKSGIKKIGFLHRSFYQYFLAKEIFSWFEQYPIDLKTEILTDHLSHLGTMKLNKTTLNYVKELYSRKSREAQKYLAPAFINAYSILKKCDGFIGPSTGRQINSEIHLGPLYMAGTVFFNVVSICSMCGHPVTNDNLSGLALRLHDMRDVNMHGAILPKAGLYHADFSGADLSDTDFTNAHLLGANLTSANLQNAKLIGADFDGAQCIQTNLSLSNCTGVSFTDAVLIDASFISSIMESAHLGGANMNYSNLSGCNLSKAWLLGALMRNADLTLANLSDANLSSTDLSYATLTLANLRTANMMNAIMLSTELRNADLTQATLSVANLSGSHLNGANLHSADLTNSILYDVDASGADLSYAQLINAKLDGIKLFRANLSHAYINWANAQYLKQRGYDISQMIILMLWHVKSITEASFSDYISSKGNPNISVTLVSENGRERLEEVKKDYLTKCNISEGSIWPVKYQVN